MNIQQLKCFVEVSQTLSFTKAGQNLFISQTAVTNHIKNLEETLGFPLFERTKKKVTLTHKGSIFLKSALKLLAVEKECYQTIQYLNHENIGELKIGYLKGIEHCILIDYIQHFYNNYPYTSIKLFRESRQQVENMLKNYDVDCIITSRIGDDLIDFKEDWCYQRIQSYPFIVAMNKNHPLAQRKNLNYFDVKNLSHIILDTSEPHFISQDLDKVLVQLSITQDTAILAQFTQDYFAYQKYLYFIPLENFPRQFHIYLVWHKNTMNDILHAFIQSMQKFL